MVQLNDASAGECHAVRALAVDPGHATTANTAPWPITTSGYSDAYVVDAVTGARKLLAKKHRGTVTLVAQRQVSARRSTARTGAPSRCPKARAVNLTAGAAGEVLE